MFCGCFWTILIIKLILVIPTSYLLDFRKNFGTSFIWNTRVSALMTLSTLCAFFTYLHFLCSLGVCPLKYCFQFLRTLRVYLCVVLSHALHQSCSQWHFSFFKWGRRTNFTFYVYRTSYGIAKILPTNGCFCFCFSRESTRWFFNWSNEVYLMGSWD